MLKFCTDSYILKIRVLQPIKFRIFYLNHQAVKLNNSIFTTLYLAHTIRQSYAHLFFIGTYDINYN